MVEQHHSNLNVEKNKPEKNLSLRKHELFNAIEAYDLNTLEKMRELVASGKTIRPKILESECKNLYMQLRN